MTKEYHCKYFTNEIMCGEKDVENFEKGRYNICKKCRIKYITEKSLQRKKIEETFDNKKIQESFQNINLNFDNMYTSYKELRNYIGDLRNILIKQDEKIKKLNQILIGFLDKEGNDGIDCSLSSESDFESK
jgi:hypothetical protein